MNSKIMILGGGINQVPLIECAKKNGYCVILCDYLNDCPGRLIADKHYLVSTFDYEGLYKIGVEEAVKGIITNSEPVMHMVARLTDALGLPTVSSKIMERFLNKDEMREWLTPLGLSDVRYKVCYSSEEAIVFWQNSGCDKMIMKPIDSSASRGVYSVNSKEDIEIFFKESIEQNRRKSAVLLEEYIGGTEFTVDGICIGGKHTTLAISKKKHYAYNENVAYELFFSYDDDAYNYDNLRKINDEIIEAAQLSYGMTHAEYKFFNGKYHLIEVAARGGGAFISTKIVPYLVNRDTVKMYIDEALGINESQEVIIDEVSKQRAAVLRFFDTPNNESGVVECIEGLDFLDSNKQILDFSLEFDVGDYIKPASTDAERIGYYIAVAETRKELLKLMDEINDRFVIRLKKD